jgi:hypothetical protein
MKLPNIISGPIKDGNTEDSAQFHSFQLKKNKKMLIQKH